MVGGDEQPVARLVQHEDEGEPGGRILGTRVLDPVEQVVARIRPAAAEQVDLVRDDLRWRDMEVPPGHQAPEVGPDLGVGDVGPRVQGRQQHDVAVGIEIGDGLRIAGVGHEEPPAQGAVDVGTGDRAVDPGTDEPGGARRGDPRPGGRPRRDQKGDRSDEGAACEHGRSPGWALAWRNAADGHATSPAAGRRLPCEQIQLFRSSARRPRRSRISFALFL